MGTAETTIIQNINTLLREQLTELLTGGFAPTVILLREFHFGKAGVVLEGLHFSAWVLLGHMRERQATLLQFIKDPENNPVVWPDAPWPNNHQPLTYQEWQQAVSDFERELEEVIALVQHPTTRLFEVQPNGKTISWAAMTALHHNAYHIGQLKTIGRQLGVW